MTEPYRDFNPYTDRIAADFTYPAPTNLQRLQAYAARLPLVSLAVPGYPITLDVNHWVAVDLAIAKQQSNIAAVIVKLTEGDGIAVRFKDPKADSYIRTSVDLGLPVGVYHFFRQNWSGDDQAKWFLDNVEQYRGLPGAKWIYPHLDRETQDGVINNETSNYRAFKWLTTVQSAWKTPGIYTNLNNWQSLFLVGGQPPAWTNDFNWWWAQWTSALTPSIPSIISLARRKFWQNGISGSHSWIPKIAGATVVDHGYFLGTVQELDELVGTVTPPPGDDLSAILERLAAVEARATAIASTLDATVAVANGAANQAQANKASIAALNNNLIVANQQIAAVKTDITTIYGRLGAVESKNTSQDATIGSLAGKVAATEIKLSKVKEIL